MKIELENLSLMLLVIPRSKNLGFFFFFFPLQDMDFVKSQETLGFNYFTEFFWKQSDMGITSLFVWLFSFRDEKKHT